MQTITIKTPNGEKRTFPTSRYATYEEARKAFAEIHAGSMAELGWTIIDTKEEAHP